jgi:hypothetical protein
MALRQDHRDETARPSRALISHARCRVSRFERREKREREASPRDIDLRITSGKYFLHASRSNEALRFVAWIFPRARTGLLFPEAFRETPFRSAILYSLLMTFLFLGHSFQKILSLMFYFRQSDICFYVRRFLIWYSNMSSSSSIQLEIDQFYCEQRFVILLLLISIRLPTPIEIGERASLMHSCNAQRIRQN